MVVPFADSAAWDWRISPPHPREPLRKGLAKGGVGGFYLIHLTSREKNWLLYSTIYLLLSILFAPYCHQNDGITPPLHTPAQSNLLYIFFPLRRIFLVGCCVIICWLAANLHCRVFFIIFALLHLTSKMMGQRPPTRSKPHAPPLSSFPTLTANTTLGWLLWLGHFKATNEPFSLNFWACVALRPPNKPTNGGAAKPDHGRLAWDHRRPCHHVVWVPLTYPRRQRAKPLGGRAVAAHVGCCVVCVLCW